MFPINQNAEAVADYLEATEVIAKLSSRAGSTANPRLLKIAGGHVSFESPEGAAATNLITYQAERAGELSVAIAGDQLWLIYHVVDGWRLTETNVVVDGFAKADHRNPRPLDPISCVTRHDPPVTKYVYNPPLPGWDEKTALIVEAGAALQRIEGRRAEVGTIALALPEQSVDIEISASSSPHSCEIKISATGVCDGRFEGYRTSLFSELKPAQVYAAAVLSSYTTALERLAALVDKPENFDRVNYAVNQDYAYLGARHEDLQAALRILLRDEPFHGKGAGGWNQSLVDQIVVDALINGKGFRPNAKQNVVLILHAVGGAVSTLKNSVALVVVPMNKFSQDHTPICQSLEARAAWRISQLRG